MASKFSKIRYDVIEVAMLVGVGQAARIRRSRYPEGHFPLQNMQVHDSFFAPVIAASFRIARSPTRMASPKQLRGALSTYFPNRKSQSLLQPQVQF